MSVPVCAASTLKDRLSRRTRARCAATKLIAASLGTLLLSGGCPPALQETPREETITLDVVFDRTGTLRSDGVFAPMTRGELIGAGDSDENRESRAFISLSLNTLPATANVTRVVLRFNAQNVFGNPFSDFPACVVDHVNVVSGINAATFSEATITSQVALIEPIPPLSARDVEIDVTASVNADRAAGRPISSFRVFFAQAPTVDGQSDGIVIRASPDNSAARPSALVTIRS
ncbi:MAG: hypothetical protein AB7N71_02145 [Phycisphaerae bacterium]